ncbi:MAG TPA: SDR family oxidoreductase [Xanthobacteraceae bacterium]|nr:SDR family oxidoreductase [Xanthobacteraceae bacterium]
MSKKILLVTGASRGIGAAVAKMAAAQGYAVAINYANDRAAAEKVGSAVEKAGSKALIVKADVAREDEVRRLFEEIDNKLGRLTHLVNNAGIVGRASRLDAADPATIRQVIDLNVTGAILVAREAAKRMSTANGGEGGAIVNLSSAAATIGSPGEFSWYAASKGAIDSFTLGLARELAKEGVRVNAVSPGLIETDIHASSGQPDRVARMSGLIPMSRAGSADEVAETILWLLSDKASYVTGANIRVAGGR